MKINIKPTAEFLLLLLSLCSWLKFQSQLWKVLFNWCHIFFRNIVNFLIFIFFCWLPFLSYIKFSSKSCFANRILVFWFLFILIIGYFIFFHLLKYLNIIYNLTNLIQFKPVCLKQIKRFYWKIDILAIKKLS